MIRPPSFLRVRIRHHDRRFGFWLPLFLAWPPIFVVGLALLPFFLVLAIVLWPFGRARPFLLIWPLLFRLLCALRGLVIDVESPSKQVSIGIT